MYVLSTPRDLASGRMPDIWIDPHFLFEEPFYLHVYVHTETKACDFTLQGYNIIFV